MTTFDEVLKEAGEFGRYQKRVFLLLCMTGITFAFLFVGVVFLGQTPDYYWCRSPGVAELSRDCGWSVQAELNYTVPPARLEGGSAHCQRYDDDFQWNSSSVGCEGPPPAALSNRSEAALLPCQDGWVYQEVRTTIVSEVRKKSHISHLCLWHRTVWHHCGICTKFLCFCDFPLSARSLCKGDLDDLLCYCDGTGWVGAAPDCWDCGSNVFHSRSHADSWHRLLDPNLAGDPAGYFTAQLPVSAILLVRVEVLLRSVDRSYKFWSA